MWEMFDSLTLQGRTLSFIRDSFKDLNINFLEEYTDVPLLKRMIRTLRKAA